MQRQPSDDATISDPVQFAISVNQAATQAVDAGRGGDAHSLLSHGIGRLSALTPVPSVTSWLEYTYAELVFRAPGDPEDHRDQAIELLQRAVSRGIEQVPELYQKAWGALGDRYATKRGDRGESRRSALRAYETALRMIPPLAPEGEWALNSLHYGTTLLEDGTDVPAVAAEGLVAYWQAAQAAHRAGDGELSGQGMAGAQLALTELVRRVEGLGEPTPFEVALPTRSPHSSQSDAASTDLALRMRMQAVVAVFMTEQRSLVTDQLVLRAGDAWEQVLAKAQTLEAESMRGVAAHYLGRLLLQLRSPEPGDHDEAQRQLEVAALHIDPAVHPWAWLRNEKELERLWNARPGPPGSIPASRPPGT